MIRHEYAVRVIRGRLQTQYERFLRTRQEADLAVNPGWEMAHNCDVALEEGESCLARFPALDGFSYHFTTHRVLRQTNQTIATVVPYADIIEVIWAHIHRQTGNRPDKSDACHVMDIVTSKGCIRTDDWDNCLTPLDILSLIAKHNRLEQAK